MFTVCITITKAVTEHVYHSRKKFHKYYIYSSSPAPGSHLSTFCLYAFAYSWAFSLSLFLFLPNCNYIVWPPIPCLPLTSNIQASSNWHLSLFLYKSTFKLSHMGKVVWYLSFCAWLIMSSKFTHVVTNDKISFFFLWLESIPLYICTTFVVSIHLLIAILLRLNHY